MCLKESERECLKLRDELSELKNREIDSYE
jgi:hypothetical protein